MRNAESCIIQVQRRVTGYQPAKEAKQAEWAGYWASQRLCSAGSSWFPSDRSQPVAVWTILWLEMWFPLKLALLMTAQTWGCLIRMRY